MPTGVIAPGAQQSSYYKGSAAAASSIDAAVGGGKGNAQLNPHYFYKKALIDIADEMFFMPLADVRAMPKNSGKTIKQYHYLPLIDDRNVNDQGIDASGVVTVKEGFVTVSGPDGINLEISGPTKTKAEAAGFKALGKLAGLSTAAAAAVKTDFATSKAALEAIAAESWSIASGEVTASGNLYGSSKDIGTVQKAFPTLTETGGRANRVGYSRRTIEATLHKMGFFDEYTQESMDFDSDADLEMHVVRESLRGANQITEAALQIDLNNGANTVVICGSKVSVATVAAGDLPVYADLKKLEIALNDAKAPKKTTIITGSRMIDTRVVGAARPLFIGSAAQEIFELMASPFDTTTHKSGAFVPVEQYAAAGTLMNGEIGKIGNFRVIVADEMLIDAGKGAAGVDVHYALAPCSGSFTSIGFQTSGKAVKFTIYHRAPGESMATREDPYAETGFHSIKWYYSTMILRSEWIGKLTFAVA